MRIRSKKVFLFGVMVGTGAVDDLAVRALFELGRTRHRINLAGQHGSDGQYVLYYCMKFYHDG